MKKHFKLYKAGKLWLVGVIATLGVMVGGQQALADTTTAQQQPATTEVVTAPTSQSVAAAQPAQPAQPSTPAKQTTDQGP